MPDWLLSALAAGMASGLASFVAVQVKLAQITVHIDYLRESVQAAHRRMDSHGIPPNHQKGVSTP